MIKTILILTCIFTILGVIIYTQYKKWEKEKGR